MIAPTDSIKVRYPADVPWCAGLLVGEGNVGRSLSRGNGKVYKYEYLHVQIGMCDERAIRRFARCFGVNYQTQFLPDRDRPFYRVMVRGRRAEQLLAILWPYIRGTDKGDQAMRYAKRLHLSHWITGRRKGLRPQLQLQKRGRKPTCD